MKIISQMARGPNTGRMTRLLKWANGATHTHMTHRWTWRHQAPPSGSSLLTWPSHDLLLLLHHLASAAESIQGGARARNKSSPTHGLAAPANRPRPFPSLPLKTQPKESDDERNEHNRPRPRPQARSGAQSSDPVQLQERRARSNER